MKLSEELTWRGLYNQSTYSKVTDLNNQKSTFYLGIDPSAPSLTIGNLATLMLAKTLKKHGNTPIILIGGATGLIGDPDGKKTERALIAEAEVNKNKEIIKKQIIKVLGQVKIIDNYDWFKDYKYVNFLRDVGKHVPMRQMLARHFVAERLGEKSSGISYAEFSYVLMQAYDFLHLNNHYNVTLQIAGSDQWGNSIAGVDLIRRIKNSEAHVLSMPLLINELTGIKFGKTEEGAIWLDQDLTSPFKFYQFWINLDDNAAIKFIKIFTDLNKPKLDEIIKKQLNVPSSRIAQTTLAEEVTKLVHGDKALAEAKSITDLLTGAKPLDQFSRSTVLSLKKDMLIAQAKPGQQIEDILISTSLATSKTEAARLLKEKAIYINNKKIDSNKLKSADFINDFLIIRRGKAYKDSALIELKKTAD